MPGKGILAGAVVLIAAGLLQASENVTDPATELEKLQGTWKLVRKEQDGGAVPKFEPLTFTVWRDEFGLKQGAGRLWGSLRLDPSTQPRAMDLIFTIRQIALAPSLGYSSAVPGAGLSYQTTIDDKTRTSRQIYKLEGDTLTVCCYRAGAERPRAFHTRPNSGLTLYVFRREDAVPPLPSPAPKAAPPAPSVDKGRTDMLPPLPPLLKSGTLVASGTDVTHVETRDFRIPVYTDPLRRNDIKELRLFVSADKGRKWELARTAPPDSENFEYSAPEDGLYWFIVQTVANDGRKNPEDVTQVLTPHLLVQVETKGAGARSAFESRKPPQPDAGESREELQKEVATLRAKVEDLERRLAKLERRPKKKKMAPAADE